MYPYRVLVTGKTLAEPALAKLKQAGVDVEFMPGLIGEETLLQAMEDNPVAAILLRGNPPVTKRVFEAARGLRVIAKHGAGIDSVDLEAARAAGVAIATAGDAGAPAVAEFALALILSLRRNLHALTERVRQGHWDRGSYQGQELAGQTLGIIGPGQIGGRLAELASGLGMQVVASGREGRRNVTGLPAVGVSFDELLRQADVVSLHCPLTPQTRGLIGAAEIARMKRGAILVNTARGALVDEAAVAAALENGQLGGAGFDTFSEEPPMSDSPLLTAPNILLTPHIGSQTSAAQERTALQAVDNILAALGATTTGSAPGAVLPA